ncbi:unnamed protein product [Camellia sinensis]
MLQPPPPSPLSPPPHLLYLQSPPPLCYFAPLHHPLLSSTATMSTPTPEKPPRKFPTPCWTQEETLALIDAYRDRWYALRRGYLRTADWDAVADAVVSRCPAVSPPKTSAQCRHKMEKLRQRYRTEKQRSLSFPGRFFSSWFFFDNMDSMASGSSLAVGSKPDAGNQVDSGVGGVLRIKNVGDRNSVESVFGSKNSKKVDGNSNPDLVLYQDKALCDRNSPPLGFRANKIEGNSSPNTSSRVLNGYPSYVDDGSDDEEEEEEVEEDFGGGFRVRTPIDGKLVPPVFRTKKLGKIHGNFGPNFDSNHFYSNGIEDGGGFWVKTPIDQEMVPPGFRPKKFSKVDSNLNPNFGSADGGFPVKMPGNRYSVPAGFRTKGYGKNGGNSCPNLVSRVSNGFDSGLGKKSDGGGRGVKRERGSISEIVSSIKLLGEGFLKMEKMKMEMAKEIEKMRMEREMKRSELILESQRQIVDAFVTVLVENKKKNENTPPVAAPET